VVPLAAGETCTKSCIAMVAGGQGLQHRIPSAGRQLKGSTGQQGEAALELEVPGLAGGVADLQGQAGAVLHPGQEVLHSLQAPHATHMQVIINGAMHIPSKCMA
jgi:hypothetical protein